MFKTLYVLLFFMLPGIAFAGSPARTVNLAAFQLNPSNPDYDAVIEGSLIPFLSAMKNHKMLASIHTEGAYSGDVITLQTSVLHDADVGLGDYGLDCQLSFKEEHESEEIFFSLGGICHVNRIGHGKSEKYTLIIPPTPFPETTSVTEEWYVLDENEAAQIVFFVNIAKQ